MFLSLFVLFQSFCCTVSFSNKNVNFNKRVASAPSFRASRPLLSSSPSVVTIGDALFDCIANDDARGFTVQQMVKENEWTAFPGGAPANVATACVKLGTSSAFCGCVGADDDGDKLENLLKEIGVDVTLLQRCTNVDDRPTRRVMVTRSIEGDREFGGFYENREADQFADCHLDEVLLQETDTDIISNAKWIVCSTLSLAFRQSAKAVYSVVEKGLKSGARLYVDVNWRPVFWPNHPVEIARDEIFKFCEKAHIVKLTDEEAEWLLPNTSAEEALENPLRIHKEYFPNALAVLVTAGEKGAAYSFLLSSDCAGKVEPFQVSVVETTGAGDAFTAGFLHALSSLENIEEFLVDKTPSVKKQETAQQLVRFAATVGALTCTKEGAIAAQPTFHEVESFLIHGEKVWD